MRVFTDRLAWGKLKYPQESAFQTRCGVFLLPPWNARVITLIPFRRDYGRMHAITAKVPDSVADELDRIASERGVSRASVLRCVIENGLQASHDNPEQYPFNPSEYTLPDATDLVRQGRVDRDSGESSE